MNSNVIIISGSGDLKVTVNEYDFAFSPVGKRTRISTPKKTAVFEVEKAKLIANTSYFPGMFRGSMFAEGKGNEITLEEDQITAMTILFSCLHTTPNNSGFTSTSIPFGSAKTKDIWYLIQACDKYNIEMMRGPVHDWFVAWYKAQDKGDLDFLAEIMFPCYTFDYASGFQEATHDLVYEAFERIKERNPTKDEQFHLPQRVIQQLNAARGRLRNILHQGLFTKVAELLRSTRCKCRKDTFYNYFQELDRINVWPLENTMKGSSIKNLLDRLTLFDASNVRGKNAGSCSTCDQNWEVIVSSARKRVDGYFDGLCLDCMSISKCLREGRDPDHDYWQHDKEKQWDIWCRIRHGEPTWWFSFMGRRGKRSLVAY